MFVGIVPTLLRVCSALVFGGASTYLSYQSRRSAPTTASAVGGTTRGNTLSIYSIAVMVNACAVRLRYGVTCAAVVALLLELAHYDAPSSPLSMARLCRVWFVLLGFVWF
jgi:hypothetical protein